MLQDIQKNNISQEKMYVLYLHFLYNQKVQDIPTLSFLSHI